jgi:DNA-binding PadR family transcriptional regulator
MNAANPVNADNPGNTLYTNLKWVTSLFFLMQNYTKGDILLTLKILQEEQTGRKRLSEWLGLGEATVRTLFRKLESESFIVSTRQGQKITEKGEEYLTRLPEFTLPKPVDVKDLTLSQYNVASLIKDYAHTIKNGIKFRDAALISGACGATTLIFQRGTFIFPDRTALDSQIAAHLTAVFSPHENDVLIIATADSHPGAVRGLSGCLGLLLEDKNRIF